MIKCILNKEQVYAIAFSDWKIRDIKRELLIKIKIISNFLTEIKIHLRQLIKFSHVQQQSLLQIEVHLLNKNPEQTDSFFVQCSIIGQRSDRYYPIVRIEKSDLESYLLENVVGTQRMASMTKRIFNILSSGDASRLSCLKNQENSLRAEISIQI